MSKEAVFEKARPCPACGAPPIIGKYKNPAMTSSLYYAECSACRWGHQTLYSFVKKKEILDAWNDCAERGDVTLRDLGEAAVEPEPEIKEASPDYLARHIIFERKPLGLFISYKRDEGYTAVDNRSGDAFTKLFSTREQAVHWLRHPEEEAHT
ncbi:MAG: hypothetical protein LBD02_01350 [Christensenellaceae bacterium]|jgi:hypothetical protein|nr:hypothetical protein [Christensenellaceae bacterium]